jgi:hypothetical protein
MNGVFHMVGSGHGGLVKLDLAVVLLIGQGVFDCGPDLAARKGIAALVALAERRQSESKRN